MAQVIIVANRLPMSVRKTGRTLEFYPSGGGLATALSSFARRRNTKWIGWPGIASDELTPQEIKIVYRELAKDHCYPVFLTRQQLKGYYNGYSNSILWPLLHSMPADLSHEKRDWKAYQEVNSLFSDIVMAHTQPQATIWVHDYQLLLLPEILRRESSQLDTRIGFFSHIPFPKTEVFAGIENASELLLGILGADLVGFHTPAYAINFLGTCHDLGIGTASLGQLILPDRSVRVTDFPISIDYSKFSQAISSQAVRHEVRKLRQKHGRRKIILTVDRLEPTKGLAERLHAYDDFLKSNPTLHRKVTMVMLCVPSRTEIKAYKELKTQLEQLVKTINKAYGTKTWKPVEFMYQSVPFEQLSALYQVAHVAFITPLRDGMNLVAKEYVASKGNRDGVLILSETAGAAHELKEAILVNPQRRRSLVRALKKAFTMPSAELQSRLSSMQQQISTHTVEHWARTFMSSLRDAATTPLPLTRSLNKTQEKQLISDFRRAKRRLLMLDYDGVLSPFFDKPSKAKPTPLLREQLEKLATISDLVIISGRSKANLEEWFGSLPADLVAEHGSMIKLKHKPWQQLVKVPVGWKDIVRPVLNKYTRKISGTFIEEKDHSLVWHYRNVNAYTAQKNATILKRSLSRPLRQFGLQIYSGSKILEIKSPKVNKGQAVARLLTASPDFIMAVGDDYTDEDMFAALPHAAYTIKVHRGKSIARFRLKSNKEVLELLQKLAKA